MKRLFFILTLTALILLPALAHACPMCQGGYSEKSVTAYKAVTLLLTLLPFILGGGIFWWLKRELSKPE